MLKNLLILAVVALATPADAITRQRRLPPPAATGGMPMNEAVANRRSVRQYDPAREIDDATLGQLLWMAVGVNRPDAQPARSGRPADRSNPTALNWQEIRVYVFGREGVWEYLPRTHSLSAVCDGDHRRLIAATAQFSQDFVLDAPYSILFVADLTGLPEGERTRTMAMVDAGIACQNLNLACASMGVATVPRASMDTAAISRLLGLTPLQIPVMNNPIGYAE